MSVMKSLDAVGWVKQKNALGLSYAGETQTFEATDTGAAGGTTIISSTLASLGGGTNDDFVGYLVEVVSASNGPTGEKGAPLRRIVTAYNAATYALTIEALPFQTVDGDSFKLLDPPHGWFAEETGGSAVNIVDAGRTEANDYWVGSAQQGGHYVEVVEADNPAKTTVRLALDFDAATDTLSCATLGANTAVGDLYEVWQYPDVVNAALVEPTYPRLDRSAITGTNGMPRGVAGLREGSGSMELAFRGPGRGREGDPAEIDTVLGAVCDATAISDVVVSSGCATNSLTVKSGTFTANQIFMCENGDAFVASVGGDPATPSPSLRNAPSENMTCYGLRRYVSSDDLNYALSLKSWHGKEELVYLWGCAPTIQFAGTRGDYLKATIGLQVADSKLTYLDSAAAAYARPWRPIRSTITPRMLGDSRVNIDAVEFEARSFSIDLGLDIQPHANLSAPNGTDGFTLVKDSPSGSLELWLDSNSKLLRQKFMMGKPMKLLIQAGEHVGEPGAFVFWAYEVEITAMEDGEDAGRRTITCQWRVTEDQTETTLSRWMIGIG